MRRYVLTIAAILLTAACSDGKPTVDGSSPSGKPARSSLSAAPSVSPSTSSSGSQRGLTGPVPTPSGKLVVVIPAGKLPYKPQAGMPALDDVKVIKTASDPCALPADNSGEEVQLLGATAGGPGTVNVTFSFTNPCSKAVVLAYKVTAAIGSAKGESAGGGAEGVTPRLHPGQTVKQTIPVDVSEDLTPEQQKQLWVGCTEVGKQDPGY